MLQGPTVDGQREVWSGLRVVPVPGAAEAVVAGLRVGDYKFNHLDRQEYPRTMVALFGKATDSRPGWMLLIICWDSYKSRYRNVNEVFATARVRQVYARLPEWLQLLPTDEPE
jgi:RecB family exonuclease